LATKKGEDEDNSDEGTSKPKAGDVKVITDAMSYEEILELVSIYYIGQVVVFCLFVCLFFLLLLFILEVFS